MEIDFPFHAQAMDNFTKGLLKMTEKESQQSNSVAGDFSVQLKNAIKHDADEIMRTFVRDVSALPGYMAACLEIGGAHCYESQEVIVQLKDGVFIRKKWNELSQGIVAEESLMIDIDLRNELQELYGENWVFRSADDKESEYRPKKWFRRKKCHFVHCSWVRR